LPAAGSVGRQIYFLGCTICQGVSRQWSFRVTDVDGGRNGDGLPGLTRALARACYRAKQEVKEIRAPAFPGGAPRTVRATARAARYGLDTGVDLDAKRAVPARELVEKFLSFVRPSLEGMETGTRFRQHPGNDAARGAVPYGGVKHTNVRNAWRMLLI